MQLEYGAPRDERETQAYGDFMRRCFDVPEEKVVGWLETMGPANVRLLRRGGRVVAGLGRVEMGQYFGGAAVPMTGIAGVGVPPEERGGGMARELMAALVRELATEGRPISTLYPATYTLYRGAGYESAGDRYRVDMPMRAVGVRDRGLPVRRVEESDAAAIEACYERSARTRPGYLARGEYCWKRTRAPRGEPADGYLVERGEEVAGYAYYQRMKGEGDYYDVVLSDLVALDAEAGRRLLTLLGDHSSVGHRVYWWEGPGAPLLALLPEAGAKIALKLPWMVRMVDPRAAVAARGFLPGMEGEVSIDLRDALLPQNTGRYVLRVADGRGELEPGGDGALELDERGLAALYTGYMSAEALRAAGRLDGAPDVLQRASALFAGPAPGMSDMF